MASSVYRGGAVVVLCLVLFSSCITAINGRNAPPPPRKKVAVEGVVYCLDCMLQNSKLVPNQYPIPGARVALRCNNTKRGIWEEEATADGNGSFVFTPRRVTSWGAHKCILYLESSPMYNCSSTGNPYPEPDGARWVVLVPLTPVKVNASSPFQFYTSASPLLFYPNWSACM